MYFHSVTISHLKNLPKSDLMKFHKTVLFATILLFIYPNHAASQQDRQEAPTIIRRAAEQGVATAQFNLGMKYLQGDGVPQDYEEAEEWFRQSAEQGNTSAQCMLGAMYATGLGVIENPIQAYMWLTLSIDGSKGKQAPFLQKATDLSNTIVKKMTPQQIEEALTLASEWKPVRMSTPRQIGGNVLRSRLIKQVKPEYPELARRARVQGVVIMLVTVNEEGNVEDVQVSRGVHPLLDEAAVAAVKQWKYSPILLNGEPIKVSATVTVTFAMGR